MGIRSGTSSRDGNTLLNASTDALGDQLNLSHVCYVPVTKGSPAYLDGRFRHRGDG